MDNDTNIDLRKLLASAALEDEKLAEELRNEGIDKFAFQKIEWKADEEMIWLFELHSANDEGLVYT